MKTFTASLFVAVLAFGAAAAVAAQQSSDLLTASQVRQLIASAQPADHAQLRAHFEALSAKYTADAARHTAMARSAGNPNRQSGGDPAGHHNRLAALAKDSAGITRELAVFAKHVVHPERSEKNGVATQPFQSEEAPDEAPS